MWCLRYCAKPGPARRRSVRANAPGRRAASVVTNYAERAERVILTLVTVSGAGAEVEVQAAEAAR